MSNSPFQSYVVPEAICPACRAVHNRAASMPGERQGPEPGDLSLCLDCGSFLLFGDKGELLVASDADVQDVEKENPAAIQMLRYAQSRIRSPAGLRA